MASSALRVVVRYLVLLAILPLARQLPKSMLLEFWSYIPVSSLSVPVASCLSLLDIGLPSSVAEDMIAFVFQGRFHLMSMLLKLTDTWCLGVISGVRVSLNTDVYLTTCPNKKDEVAK